MFKMKVLCMFWICKFFIIPVIHITGAISPCGSFPVSMAGGLIFCSPMVASTLPVTTTVSSPHNTMQMNQVKGRMEEQATDLSIKPGEETEGETKKTENVKIEAKVVAENDKPVEKEKYVRFKNMDFGSYNEGRSKGISTMIWEQYFNI